MATFSREVNTNPALGILGTVADAADINAIYDNLERLTTVMRDVREFGATGNGVTDDAAAINAAIDELADEGGGMLLLPPMPIKVTTIQLKAGVTLMGQASNVRIDGGTKLIGTAGANVIELPTSGNREYFGIRHLKISGGLNGLVSTDLATYVHLEDVDITSPEESCIYTEGQVEKWRLRDVYLAAGDYGFRHVDVGGAFSLVDKCNFENVACDGQTINAWSIKAQFSNTCVWINPIINTAGQHGFVADGGIRGWTFINANTEGNGHLGTNARTNGTINSASNSLALASATGFAQGDQVTVAGAMANGDDLVATISTLVGTTATLSTTAGTSVVSAKVTNARYDDFSFGNSIAYAESVQFLGGIIGGEGSLGHLRYAVDMSVALDVAFIGARTASGIPIYDPTFQASVFGGAVELRQPSGVADKKFIRASFPTGGTSEAARAVLPSPGGKPITVMLNDSALNGTGTRDKFEVRKYDANRTRMFNIDATTNDVVQEQATGHLTANGILRINPKANPATCSVGDMNIHTDNKLYLCTAANTWTVVGSQS